MNNLYIADTNILIRLLTKDDDAQVHTLARGIVQNNVILYLLPMVVIETYWVLNSVYKFDKSDIVQALIDLIESEGVMLEEEMIMRRTLDTFCTVHVDLVDVYLAEKSTVLGYPVLAWNKKDFRKLHCKFFQPEQLI